MLTENLPSDSARTSSDIPLNRSTNVEETCPVPRSSHCRSSFSVYTFTRRRVSDMANRIGASRLLTSYHLTPFTAFLDLLTLFPPACYKTCTSGLDFTVLVDYISRTYHVYGSRTKYSLISNWEIERNNSDGLLANVHGPPSCNPILCSFHRGCQSCTNCRGWGGAYSFRQLVNPAT